MLCHLMTNDLKMHQSTTFSALVRSGKHIVEKELSYEYVLIKYKTILDQV